MSDEEDDNWDSILTEACANVRKNAIEKSLKFGDGNIAYMNDDGDVVREDLRTGNIVVIKKKM